MAVAEVNPRLSDRRGKLKLGATVVKLGRASVEHLLSTLPHSKFKEMLN